MDLCPDDSKAGSSIVLFIVLMLLRAFILCVLTAATLVWCAICPAPVGGHAAGVVMTLPRQLGPLLSQPDEASKVEKEMLPTDTEFAKATYFTAQAKDDERDIVQVSVVLAGAESRSIHRPEVCLIGQGWSIVDEKTVPVEITKGRTLYTRDLTIEGTFVTKPGEPARRLRAHYVYWFVGTAFNTPSHSERMWHSTWDAVLHNVNHRWAYVSMMALITEGTEPATSGQRQRTDEQTQRLVHYVIQGLVPQFQKDFIANRTTNP
jgi:hypothetical protein